MKNGVIENGGGRIGKKIKTTEELMDIIKEYQGLDIKKLLTKKGREHEVKSMAVDILQSEGYEAKLVEIKKGYEIETNAPEEKRREAIEQAKDMLIALVKSTQQMLRTKLGL